MTANRVVAFGHTDVNTLSSVEFKNIPTDFCQLRICGMLRWNPSQQGGGDSYLYVEFQNSGSNNRMFQHSARYSYQSNTQHVIGMGHTGQPHGIMQGNQAFSGEFASGENQASFEMFVMEPGSGRAKSLNYEMWNSGGQNNFRTINRGQMRVDPQDATSNADSKSVLDQIKITGAIPGLTPNSAGMWGPGSTMWLEGWGGGHP